MMLYMKEMINKFVCINFNAQFHVNMILTDGDRCLVD